MTVALPAPGARVKILFVIGQLGYGGSEKQLTLLASRLAGAYAVEVLCTSTDLHPYAGQLAEAGVPVMHPKNAGLWQRLWFVARTLAGRRDDIVYFFSIRNAVALLVMAFTRAKVIYTERSLGVWKSRLYLFIDRLLYRFCDRIVANARATLDFHVAEAPEIREKSCVIYNGIEPCPLPDPRPAMTETVFVMVANFSPWKGHTLLAEAAGLLARERDDFRILLVGDGPLRPAVERAVDQNHLRERVHFLGRLTEPHPVVEQADINLLLSRHESLSNSLMEGMLAGKGSIVTAVGGNAELIQDGVHGRVVPYGDPKALAAAMREAMDRKELFRAFGRAARERILQEFTVERMVEQNRRLIDGVL